MIHLSSFEQPNNALNIKDIGVSVERTEPTESYPSIDMIVSSEDKSRLLKKFNERLMNRSYSLAMETAAETSLLFPDLKGFFQLYSRELLDGFNEKIEQFKNLDFSMKDIDLSHVLPNLFNAKIVFPDQVNKMVAAEPELFEHIRTQITYDIWNYVVPSSSKQAADFSVVTGKLFDPAQVGGLLIRSMRELHQQRWWESTQDEEYFGFLSGVLGVWLYFPDQIESIRPPQEAQDTIVRHLRGLIPQHGIILYMKDLIGLQLLFAKSVVLTDDGLRVVMPDQKIQTNDLPPTVPPRRKF